MARTVVRTVTRTVARTVDGQTMPREHAARAHAARRSATAAAALLAASLLAGSMLACGGKDTGAGDASSGANAKQAPAIGAAAPAFTATDLAGAPVSLAALKGQVVVLNVWATWCQPCRLETPVLQALHASIGTQGVKVIGVSVDGPGSAPDVQDFRGEFGVTYDLWLDPQKDVQVKFLTVGVPETFVLDRGGVIRYRHIGPVAEGDTALMTAVRGALGS